MRADSEDGLPARHRVGADHRMDGGEGVADVFGGAARSAEQLETVFLGGFAELGLRIGGGEGFEEFLVRAGDAVEELVSGGPESVFCKAG